jgi:hypothetical protein
LGAARIITTWDPTTNSAIPFEWQPGMGPNKITAGSVLGTELQTFAPDPNGQDVLQYLRGSTA